MRGLDALLYLETLRELLRKGYTWVDMSLIAEHNVMSNLLARHMGGERYKVYRTYEMPLLS